MSSSVSSPGSDIAIVRAWTPEAVKSVKDYTGTDNPLTAKIRIENLSVGLFEGLDFQSSSSSLKTAQASLSPPFDPSKRA